MHVQNESPSDTRNHAPVFVVGCPRSGTTLVYHMLLSAGNFAIYRAESQVFNLLEPRFGDLSRGKNRHAMLSAWLKSPLFTKTGLDPQEIVPNAMAKCRNGGDFLRITMELLARKQGVTRWADSTPEHVLFLHRIKQTLPDALIVHVIRDGRDVAISLEKQGWIRPLPWDRGKELEVAAVYWDWIVRKGRAAGQQLGKDYLELRYEDIVQDARRSLVRLSDFIGQELDYDQIQRNAVGSVGRPNTSFSSELREGEFQPLARWKQHVPQEQQKILGQLIGETLAELDYCADELPKQIGNRSLRRIRSFYHAYFNTKFFLKTKTPLGKIIASKDLSWT